MKKILLINPVLSLEKNFIDYPFFVNQGIYLVREILKSKGNNVHIFDSFCNPVVKITGSGCTLGSNEELDDTINQFKPGISVILNSPFLGLFKKKKNKHVDGLIKKLKASNSKVILADCFITGMHYYDYDLEGVKKRYDFDAVCKHECEVSLLHSIESLESFDSPVFMKALDELPLIKLSKSELNSYNQFLAECWKSGLTDIIKFDKKTMPLATSRGCVYNCVFCSSRVHNRKYRQHSLDYFEKQIDYLTKCHDVKKIVFMDDLLNASKDRLQGILGLLEKYGLECSVPNGLRAENLDEKLLSQLKKLSGWVKVSAETGSSKTMKTIGKKMEINSVISVAETCKKIKLPLYIHFAIGFPGETVGDMNKTLRFALELSEKYGVYPLLQFASPIKGSELYNMAENPSEDYMGYFDGNYQVNRKSLRTLKKSFEIALNKEKLEKAIINVTYKCNNNCIMCAIGDRRGLEGDYDYQLERMKEAKKEGATSIDFDGGEPTLSRDIFRLIKTAKKLGYSQINLTTNGRMMSSRQNAEKIVNLGITSILFSLHGPNADIHERITRVPGSFEETVKAIKNSLDIAKGTVDIGINITLTNDNTHFLVDFADYIKKLGVKKLNVQLLTPFGVADKSMLPAESVLISNVNKLMNKHGKSLEINLINFLPCMLEKSGNKESFVSDFSKNQRNMIFIDREEQNLADFLAKKRFKTLNCAECPYDIICGGFWKF